MTDTINKQELLKMLTLKKSKWLEIKEKKEEHDVTHENFISDIILAFDWIINDVTNL